MSLTEPLEGEQRLRRIERRARSSSTLSVFRVLAARGFFMMPSRGFDVRPGCESQKRRADDALEDLRGGIPRRSRGSSYNTIGADAAE